jgi:hypothetical protein
MGLIQLKNKYFRRVLGGFVGIFNISKSGIIRVKECKKMFLEGLSNAIEEP